MLSFYNQFRASPQLYAFNPANNPDLNIKKIAITGKKIFLTNQNLWKRKLYGCAH
jgi:hypothetical protein